MAEKANGRTRLQMLVGVVKDQVSTGIVRAKNGHLAQIDLAVLRATTHDEQGIQEEAVRAVLEIGTSSRMRVAHCTRVIMDRLNKTSSWVVALKCLIIIHRCLHEGGFMFQDLLSLSPATGGHNYLNLSKFKDTSSTFTWVASAWVRWYAGFIEQWIQTARNTKSFLGIQTYHGSVQAGKLQSARLEKLLALENRHLLKDIEVLHDLLHEVSAWQAEDVVMQHVLVKEGLRLVSEVTLVAYEEIKLRLFEIQKRVATLDRSQVLSLSQVCENLSTESMVFTHLFEVVKEWGLQQDHVAVEGNIFTDYELISLKQAFMRASISNSALLPEKRDYNGYQSLGWRSSSWSTSNKTSGERTKLSSSNGFTSLI